MITAFSIARAAAVASGLLFVAGAAVAGGFVAAVFTLAGFLLVIAFVAALDAFDTSVRIDALRDRVTELERHTKVKD